MKFPPKFKTITALFIIALIVNQHQVNCIFAILTSISSIVSIGYAIYGTLNDAHDTYNKFTTASTQDVMDKVVEIAETLDRIGTNLEKKLDNTLDTLLRRLPLANKIDENIQELNQYITRIDSLFRDFEEYVRDAEAFDSLEIDAVTEASLSRDAGDVRDVIDKMHALMVPGRVGAFKKSLLLLLAEESMEYALELCDTGTTPQERVFELYSIVMVTEIRAYALTGFAFLRQSMKQNTTLQNSLTRLEDKFNLRAKQYVLTLKAAMGLSPTLFRRCDPPQGHIRGETFVEFERFMQAFIVQEPALSDRHTCMEDCGTYTRTHLNTGCEGFECSGGESTCYGELKDCTTLDAPAICELEPFNARRYQYVDDHGYSDKECEGDRYYPKPYSSFPNKCDLCKCTCIEEDYKSKSFHYVNLRPQESDIENNKIVTGVRFVMEKRILTIQIQEGVLEANGTIFEETTGWQELEYIEYDEDLSVKYDEYRFDKKHQNETNFWWERLYGRDIGTIMEFRQTFFLDDLRVPENHVVTGVKFARLPKDEHRKMPFYLMIRYTAFDYYTGKLENIEDTKWMYYKDTPYGQEGVYRQDHGARYSHNPLQKNKSVVTSKPNEFIEIYMSSWYEDAAQTVLPLIDALPIYGNPLTPLAGIALHHKAPEGTGGFLTFVISGVNKAPYIQTEE